MLSLNNELRVHQNAQPLSAAAAAGTSFGDDYRFETVSAVEQSPHLVIRRIVCKSAEPASPSVNATDLECCGRQTPYIG